MNQTERETLLSDVKLLRQWAEIIGKQFDEIAGEHIVDIASRIEALASRTPEGTVRVRAAVAINLDASDCWGVHGRPTSDSDREREVIGQAMNEAWTANQPQMHVAWIEADVPIPQPQTVEGQVTT